MSLPPPHRKSPIRHTVRTHIKKTPKTHRIIKINEYLRGKGVNPKTVRKRTTKERNVVHKSKHNISVPRYLGMPEKVSWRFSTQDKTLDLNAPDVQTALSVGLAKVRGIPKIIRIRRLSD